MVDIHLKKILSCLSLYTSDEDFNKYYSPTYLETKIDITLLEKIKEHALCFDYNKLTFLYLNGTISASGVSLNFRSDRFENINVCVFYDWRNKKIYNQVLLTPKYTDYDFLGKKSIRQTSNKVTSHKDIERYIKKIYSKFECPFIDIAKLD